MSFETLLTANENGILTITINRPDKLNALNKTTLDELRTAFLQGFKDPAVHGIILTGSGNKAFVAGADISEFLKYSQEQGKNLAAHGHEIFDLIENGSKPVIAAVNGFALGGGCELMMACHLRIASVAAKFGQPEVNLGLIPGYGGTQRLVRYIGKTKATELLLTGDMIGAEDALKLGLVNAVVPAEELMMKCNELLVKITSKSSLAVAEIITCVNAFDEGSGGMNTEMERFGACFGTEDFKEGVTAFLEKRKPDFHKVRAK